MGSRGSFLKTGGFTEYSYRTLIRYNNTRFVVQKDVSKSVKLPERSNSKWAVYATLSRNGDLQSVSFYDGGRRLFKEVDFLHAHDKMSPHVHDIDPSAKSFRTRVPRELTKAEKTRIDRIVRFYKKHDVKDLANSRSVK